MLSAFWNALRTPDLRRKMVNGIDFGQVVKVLEDFTTNGFDLVGEVGSIVHFLFC